VISLAFRTLLVFGLVLGALAMSDLGQPPRLLAQLQISTR
jgi:hypothetical protein